jgi:Peptidase A4 family
MTARTRRTGRRPPFRPPQATGPGVSYSGTVWGGLVWQWPSATDGTRQVGAGPTAISCSFTVPSLSGNGGNPNAGVYLWVGLGDVQQTGIDCIWDTTQPGNNAVAAWQEMIPGIEYWDSVNFPVRAGDKLTLSLSFDDSYWYIRQANATRGWDFTEQKSIQAGNIGGSDTSIATGTGPGVTEGPYLFPFNQAEIIAEWPVGGYNLANFGTVTFTGITATPAPTTGELQYITLVNGSSTTVMSVGTWNQAAKTCTFTWKGYS